VLKPTITALAAARSSTRNYCARLADRGDWQAFAGVTQPNEASNGFHRSFGFEDVGLYR
jgi:L-amino acid N-acyltransferase YncA